MDISEHYIIVGALIKVHRNNKGLSQTEVGDYVGITKSMVSKWERGEHLENASISKIAKLCLMLDMNPLMFVYNPEDVSLIEYISALRAYLDSNSIDPSKISDDKLIKLVDKALKEQKTDGD